MIKNATLEEAMTKAMDRLKIAKHDMYAAPGVAYRMVSAAQDDLSACCIELAKMRGQKVKE